MVLSFLSIKVTSVFLGPAGLGVLSQLNYFISMSQGVLVSGLKTGIVRRTAEWSDDEGRRARVISTVMRLLLVVGLPVAGIMALASGWLARELLHDATLRIPILVFACAYTLGMVAALIEGSANGAKDFRATATISITTNIIGLVLIVVLCPTLGITGGLLAAALMPGILWAVSVLMARRKAWWPRNPLSHGYSNSEARAALAFVPMATISAITMPLIQILVRDGLAEHSGMSAVGLLQGVMRISDMYLGIVSGVFSMYYLPRFSEIKIAKELRHELLKGVFVIVPGVALLSFVIYLSRDIIISTIFTKEFAPMRELFGWQMVGNTLKMVGWLFGYLLLAKAHPLAMAAYELASGVLWWQLSVHLIHANGALGATQAFAATYAIYSAVGLVGVMFVLHRMPARPDAMRIDHE
jgi:PST family polysaccharide transporter